jgi:hypothetical protein
MCRNKFKGRRTLICRPGDSITSSDGQISKSTANKSGISSKFLKFNKLHWLIDLPASKNKKDVPSNATELPVQYVLLYYA